MTGWVLGAAGAAGLGAWLRWGVVPVAVAFRLGSAAARLGICGRPGRLEQRLGRLERRVAGYDTALAQFARPAPEPEPEPYDRAAGQSRQLRRRVRAGHLALVRSRDGS